MKNMVARLELERIYGKGCMFEKADIINKLQKQKIKIKGFKEFVKSKAYRSKKLRMLLEKMTYHHLVHLSDGGKTNVENGAIVSALAHQYIHSLPKDEEKIINDMLQEYKESIILDSAMIQSNDEGVEVQVSERIDLDEAKHDFFIIPLQEEKERYDKRSTRAKRKAEMRKIIREELM